MVERGSYLLELARYVALNPLRAKMVMRLEVWPWSSYSATCGQVASPPWLQTDWMLGQFGARRFSAIAKYVSSVHEGARPPSIWTQLPGQIYLGSEAFVKKKQTRIEQKLTLSGIPRAQRRAITQPLSQFETRYPRSEAMAWAYLSGQHSMQVIAQHFGAHYSTVSSAIKNLEKTTRA